MRTKRVYCSVLLFLAYNSHGSLCAQSWEKQIDSLILTEFVDSDGPGGVFMVAKAGQVIYEKGFGKANIELDVDMAPKHVFQLGSMTKQFTAVAILLLEGQGKLNVSDPLARFLPDYPSGDRISIHHLLTHTSGIKDFTKMEGLGAIAQKDMTPKMMVDFFKDESVDFSPGERFEYNNAGYVLLGYIIELVSERTYADFIQEYIFDKVGMLHSYYASDRQVIKHRAYGYHLKAEGYVNKSRISFSVPFSSGSLMSTVGDMLIWQNALNQHRILDPVAMRKAFQPYRLDSGEAIGYGYGWHLKEMDGEAVREHGGSIFGFKTMGVYIPGRDIYVLGFSNCDCRSPTQLTRDIAKLVLATVAR